MAELRIGTSAFTAAGWPGSFYPKGMQPRDFLTYYATKFDSVEVDSTFDRKRVTDSSRALLERITLQARLLLRVWICAFARLRIKGINF
jgi:hypothetical protein